MNTVHLSDTQPDRIVNFCIGMVHIGKEIKKKSKELKIGAAELATLINTTKQNIYLIFKKKSIDTDQLKKISEALRFNFFNLYREDLRIIASEPEAHYASPEVMTKQVSSKAIDLQGQQVLIVKRRGKHQIGQLFSLLPENYEEDKQQSIVKYIDLLPQIHLRNEDKKKEYRALRDQGREDIFRLKYCEQIPVQEISDIQYLDDHFQDEGLINKN